MWSIGFDVAIYKLQYLLWASNIKMYKLWRLTSWNRTTPFTIWINNIILTNSYRNMNIHMRFLKKYSFGYNPITMDLIHSLLLKQQLLLNTIYADWVNIIYLEYFNSLILSFYEFSKMSSSNTIISVYDVS